MPQNFLSCDRDQSLLLPPDLRDWVPADHLVHFLIDAMDGISMSAAKVNRRGTGSAQYPPAMMLGLLIYSYATGVFGSRNQRLLKRYGVLVAAANALSGARRDAVVAACTKTGVTL